MLGDSELLLSEQMSDEFIDYDCMLDVDLSGFTIRGSSFFFSKHSCSYSFCSCLLFGPIVVGKTF